jgi:hypothetical protein
MIDIARRMRWDPVQLTDSDVIRASAHPKRPDHRVPATTGVQVRTGDHAAVAPRIDAPPVPAPVRVAAGCPIATEQHTAPARL